MDQHELKTTGEDDHHHRQCPSPASFRDEAQSQPEVRNGVEKTPKRSTRARTFFIILGSLYLGTFLVALDTTIIGTALYAITAEFHALEHLAWYGTAYLLTFTALQPTFGKLYKGVDTKLMYLVSIAIFEAGSTLCAAAPSSIPFITGQAVAGCGAAGLMQGAFAIVVKTVPISRRPMYFGLFVGVFGVSIGVGPVLGGMFADRGMWRWCFWINLPLGAVVFLLISAFLRLGVDAAAKPRKCGTKHFLFTLDLGGSALLISSLTALFLAMQWGGQKLPWNSLVIIILFITFGILAALFVLLEWKMGDDASVPFSTLRQQSIASGVVYLFFIAMPNFSYGVYIPIFFQKARTFSAQRSGAELLFLALTQIATVVIVGAWVSKFGCYTPFIMVGTGISVVGAGLITMLGHHTTHVEWVAYFIVCGIGTGMAINLPYTAVSAVLKEADVVTGNALLQFAFQLGGATSLCISQALFVRKLGSKVHDVPGVYASGNDQDTKSIYQAALRSVFIFLLAASSLAFLASFGFEHKNVKMVEQTRDAGCENVAGGE